MCCIVLNFICSSLLEPVQTKCCEPQMSSTPNCQTFGQNADNSSTLRQTAALNLSLHGIRGLNFHAPVTVLSLIFSLVSQLAFTSLSCILVAVLSRV